MRIVRIMRNARLKRDDDGLYWLLIESSAGQASFNLSLLEINPITRETVEMGFDAVLEAFMAEQETPIFESEN